MSELAANNLENEPDAEFMTVLNFARRRFNEAVAQQTWGYRHFVIGSHPETGDIIATYGLTYDYGQMIKGESELLSVTLPIKPSNLLAPEPAKDADYFTIGLLLGDQGQPITVRRDNFQALFNDEEAAPVSDLMHKLITYEVVPICKMV